MAKEIIQMYLRPFFKLKQRPYMRGINMTLPEIRNVIQNFSSVNSWQIKLLRYTFGKRIGCAYLTRAISLNPISAVAELINDIQREYLETRLGHYTSIEAYDGSDIVDIIYFLRTNDELLSAQYARMVSSIDNPDTNRCV